MAASPSEGSSRRWLKILVLVLTHVVVFAFGVLGDIYVLRFGAMVEHAAGGGPLIFVSRSWPDAGCSPAAVAMPHGGPAPAGARFSGVLSELGGVAYGSGLLDFRLSARDDKSIYVFGLHLVTFQADPLAVPDWAGYLEAGGCGGVNSRVFEGHVDQSTELTDRGIVDEGGELDPQAPQARLGADFTVNASDPAHLLVHLDACRGYYEFGLQIEYNYLGDNYVDILGTPSEPFRLIGDGQAVPTYAFSTLTAPPRLDGVRAGRQCTASESKPTTPTTTARTFPQELEGTWSGTLHESTGRAGQMYVTIVGGQNLATVRYPDARPPCAGELLLTDINGNDLVVRERITAGGCTPTGRMLIKRSGATLEVSYFPDGASYTAAATLARE